jgi:hypothetical protein
MRTRLSSWLPILASEVRAGAAQRGRTGPRMTSIPLDFSQGKKRQKPTEKHQNGWNRTRRSEYGYEQKLAKHATK